MDERFVLIQVKHMLFAAISMFVIIVILLCITITRHTSVHTDSSYRSGKSECYISIQVRLGESLWNISKKYYSNEYKNMNLYIKKIMLLNHMVNEDICAGAYLIIPYYASENQQILPD